MYVMSIRSHNFESRAGYFSTCVDDGSGIRCGSPASMAGNGTITDTVSLAQTITQHTIKPYFFVIALGFVALACGLLCLSMLLPSKLSNTFTVISTLSLMVLGWMFSIFAAIWQEVAVNSAVCLRAAHRGYRASVSAWTSVAFLTVTLVIEIVSLFRSYKMTPRIGMNGLSTKSSVDSGFKDPQRGVQLLRY